MHCGARNFRQDARILAIEDAARGYDRCRFCYGIPSPRGTARQWPQSRARRRSQYRACTSSGQSPSSPHSTIHCGRTCRVSLKAMARWTRAVAGRRRTTTDERGYPGRVARTRQPRSRAWPERRQRFLVVRHTHHSPGRCLKAHALVAIRHGCAIHANAGFLAHCASANTARCRHRARSRAVADDAAVAARSAAGTDYARRLVTRQCPQRRTNGSRNSRVKRALSPASTRSTPNACGMSRACAA